MPNPHRQASAVSRLWPRIVTGVVAAAAVLVVLIVVLANRGERTSVNTSSGTAAQASVGSAAPPVVLPATTDQTVDLSAFRGKRNVLLYFYEHAG